MKALELLKNDHETVRQLFRQFESVKDEAEHRRLVESIKTELQTHAHIEESIFYPALDDTASEDVSELVDEALDAHHAIEVLLDEIDRLNRDGQELRAKVAELKEKVEHHAKREEEEMFARARALLTEDDLEDIGQELEDEKKIYSPIAA
jgi:hemerythrin superfamily protein